MVTTAIHIDQLALQLHHWKEAALRLSRLENMASAVAWDGVDQNIRKQIVGTLRSAVDHLLEQSTSLEGIFPALPEYQRFMRLQRFRQQYLSAETTVHFFTDALNSRTNGTIASILRACDILCYQSMEGLLRQLGKDVPYCFTYVDKGLGASILKSGLKLWDGTVSPIAAIKITLHNLSRPTAAVHETGHQVAHILGWNEAMRERLSDRLKSRNSMVAELYASWASEIVADAYAFVHTGYAAVASLYNVVAGSPGSMFAVHHGDPHPPSYIRVLLNISFCRIAYGAGPWDQLGEAVKEHYTLERITDDETKSVILQCEQVVDLVARICIGEPFEVFRGKALKDVVDPWNVSPASLAAFAHSAKEREGSHTWLHGECLRMLALSGFRMATDVNGINEHYTSLEKWMLRLGLMTTSKINTVI